MITQLDAYLTLKVCYLVFDLSSQYVVDSFLLAPLHSILFRSLCENEEVVAQRARGEKGHWRSIEVMTAPLSPMESLSPALDELANDDLSFANLTSFKRPF
ncbi:hypothetical protein LOAG_04455 [Loa loa]|uniref:Uncharacterized protein n=1 Tax=Loa loa TaxID=7209 RepID=A0A1S0U2K4_LOALO|nr:hypothetical protein LOAG_04455 [Loa loa]EFO24030.1 hypothetical protein LOAG_04455 [Loa loa]